MVSGEPLPIAALLIRARNAKSAKERHDLAYFGWEASVRLAVAIRPPVDRERLALPSTGDWVDALETDDRIVDDPALLAVQRLLASEGLGRGSTPKTTTAKRVLEGLAAYRNLILGHGAVRTQEFYERAGEILAVGLDVAWQRSLLWQDQARLVYVESVAVDEDGSRRARVLDLTGTAARVLEPRGVRVDDDVLPRRVYVGHAGTYRSLHPWLIFEAAELRERVLFFNGRSRSARYLDYVGGEQVKGKPLADGWPTIEQDLDAAMLDHGDDTVEISDPARFGDYRILGKLGEGGMGVVYLARQDSVARAVALKMLPTSAADDPVAVARFQREITALARCEHPNVVKILSAGEMDGQRYYAMELVEGADLAEVARELATGSDFDHAVTTASERVRAVRQDAFADVPAVTRDAPELPTHKRDRVRALVELFRDAARALDHLHGLGIIHRDVKPANLMVTAGDHRVVVMDLGLASLGDASRSLTKDKSSILGTLRYLPPEQLQRSLVALDRRADVYSLGATFYELLTGRPFFEGDSEARLVEQVLRETPRDAHAVNSAVSRDLSLILGKATDKDPRRRYDDAEALARDLDAYLDGRPIAARAPSVGYVLSLWMRRHRGIAATVIVAFLLATAGAAWFLVRERRLRASAELARDRARESEAAAQEALAWNQLEEGRQELLDHHPGRAATHLLAAASRLWDEPSLRSLMADAMREVERARVRLVGHDTSIGAVAFSPDGGRAVTASADGTARVWDTGSGTTVATLRGHTGTVTSCAFAADGARVLTASADHTVRVWDAASGAQLANHPGTEAVWSPDGARVASAGAGAAPTIWDAATGASLVSMAGTDTTIGFAANGAAAVTTGEGAARIWDATTGALRFTLTGDTPIAAAFGTAGALVVTAGNDHAARIWDASTGEQRAVLVGHTAMVTSAALSPDGKLALTASDDGSARIWEVATAKTLATLGGNVASAVFSADGSRVLTTSYDGSARVWDAGGAPVATLDGHIGAVRAAAFSADGRRAITASDDATAWIWDVQPRRTLATLSGHTQPLAWAGFDADGRRVVTTSWDGDARIWDAASGAETARLGGHVEGVLVADFDPSGRHVLTAGLDDDARLWDADTGASGPKLDGHTDDVMAASFSPDGALVVTASEDQTIRLWNADSGTLRAKLVADAAVFAAAFSPDGRMLATATAPPGDDETSRRFTAQIWDVATGDRRAVLDGHVGGIWWIAWSPDGKRVVTAGEDRVARVWDASTGALVTTLSGHHHALRTAEFSDDGASIVTSSQDQTARVWDARTGEQRATLVGHTHIVWSAMFSPDGGRVLTASLDGTARLWDPTTGKLLAVLEGHTAGLFATAFSPDGLRVVTASLDGTARIWDVHLETRSVAQLADAISASRAARR